MEITLMEYLIVCPLVFLAGFVDAIAGGGGLISLPAYLIAGFPVHFAIGTNKLSSGMGTAIATWKLYKLGHIEWKLALICTFFALVGSGMGASIALLIPDAVFKLLMLFIIPITAYYILKKKEIAPPEEKLPWKKVFLVSSAVALVIGMYDGFYGPGTGTFLLLLLTSMATLSLKEANGIAKVINLTTNLTALAVYLINGKALILFGILAGIFSILGNYIGTWFFEKKGSFATRPIMLLVLAIFFIKVVSELDFKSIFG